MINKLSYFAVFLFITGITTAQINKEYSCSHVKSKELTAKTPTMSNTQQAETYKYNVHFYELNLNISNTSTYISGSGSIHAKTVVATDSILFELYKTFTIDSILLNNVNTPFKQYQSVVKVPANLSANNDFKLTVYYKGNPPTAATNPLGGAGLSQGSPNGMPNVKVTWTLSEPFSAYEWFPVKQVLNDKADSCAINLTVANGLKAGANGVLDSVTNNGNGTSTYHWFHRYPISYYLISVAVSDYIEYNTYAFTGTPNEILIQNYVYNDNNFFQSRKADIDETGAFIELFSDLYGMYPFANEKYGHCNAPISGGMEHQTMTTQGDFDQMLTSHELAHQWWGDYVTCASWADIWLNEGFASYSEYLMYEHLYPNQAASDMSGRHTNIMSQPGGSVYVTDSINDASIFSNRLTYNKGAAIIHTLRYIINNDSVFFLALNTYLDTYKNKTATGLDMKNILETVSGLDLSDFFDQWYFGEGFPTYFIKWNKVGNDLHLNIKQTASTSTTPFFTNPLSLKISRLNGLSDTIIRIENITSADVNQVITNFTNINNIVKMDPDNWVINKVGGIQKDASFTVSTMNNSPISELKIYPIPASDVVTIAGKEKENYLLEIVDLRGVLVDSYAFQGKISVPVHKYPNGSYLLRITNSENHAVNHRFVKF